MAVRISYRFWLVYGMVMVMGMMTMNYDEEMRIVFHGDGRSKFADNKSKGYIIM